MISSYSIALYRQKSGMHAQLYVRTSSIDMSVAPVKTNSQTTDQTTTAWDSSQLLVSRAVYFLTNLTHWRPRIWYLSWSDATNIIALHICRVWYPLFNVSRAYTGTSHCLWREESLFTLVGHSRTLDNINIRRKFWHTTANCRIRNACTYTDSMHALK